MDSVWLAKQFLAQPAKTKAGLALALGLPASAVSKMINGSRAIKAKEYLTMRKFFGFETDIKTRKNLEAVRSPAAFFNDLDQEKLAELKPIYDVVVIADSAMLPHLRPQDRVLINRKDKLPHRPALYAIRHNGVMSVRYVSLDGARDYAVQDGQGNSTSYIPRDEVEILGSVIAKLAAI